MKLNYHLVGFSTLAATSQAAPTVQIRNGTYRGVFNPALQQDLFLGMPFAQPPVGDLRFRVPQSLNHSWIGTRDAVAYSAPCIGYSNPGVELVPADQMSEDCLTINVVRPSGVSPNASLPVAVWIHGGGLVEGSSMEPSYNLSFLVQQSVDMGTPMIAASMNYRLSAWGFLFSKAMADEGSDHLGFRDQRLALHWVQENIAAFGGDKSKVTIFGESAGAWSVGAQLLAHGGRDDKLFRAAALQSGVPMWAEPDHMFTADDWEPIYQTVLEQVNCGNATDTLACLRESPVQKLSEVFRDTFGESSITEPGHYVDGDFFRTSTQTQFSSGDFPHVPILLGANFDEGVEFGQSGINTTQQFLESVRRTQADEAAALEIAELYPDDPDVGIPASMVGRPSGNITSLGSQYKRMAAFGGDLWMHGPRRFFAQALAAHNLTAYNYHWNVITGSPEQGANHFSEVAFVFNDMDQFKDHPKRDKYLQLGKMVSSMWVSFFTTGSPNHSNVTAHQWPLYTADAANILVFDDNVNGFMYNDLDTYREKAIRKVTDIMFPLYGYNNISSFRF